MNKKNRLMFLFISTMMTIPMSAIAQTEAAIPLDGTVEIAAVENKVDWRREGKSWASVSEGISLEERSEIRTEKNKGKTILRFAEESRVEVGPGTQLSLDSLKNKAFLLISLKQGELDVQVSPKSTSEKSFTVMTPAAMVVVEGTIFSVRHQKDLTTVSVKEGIVFVQPASAELYPVNIEAGQQISLTKKEMGPVVAAGASPGISEPELPYKLLDLGHLQVCEIREKEICGSWSWDLKTQQFNATWEDGTISVLKVEKMGGGEIILTSNNLSGPTQGVTARYTGHLAGQDMEGDVGVQLLEGTVAWKSPGSNASGTWRSRSHYFLEL